MTRNSAVEPASRSQASGETAKSRAPLARPASVLLGGTTHCTVILPLVRFMTCTSCASGGRARVAAPNSTTSESRQTVRSASSVSRK